MFCSACPDNYALYIQFLYLLIFKDPIPISCINSIKLLPVISCICPYVYEEQNRANVMCYIQRLKKKIKAVYGDVHDLNSSSDV